MKVCQLCGSPTLRVARGLCAGCYQWECRAGTLDDWERSRRPISDVVADCTALAGETVETIAARLGYVSKDSLYHTLHRNGRLDVWLWLKREASA